MLTYSAICICNSERMVVSPGILAARREVRLNSGGAAAGSAQDRWYRVIEGGRTVRLNRLFRCGRAECVRPNTNKAPGGITAPLRFTRI